MAEPQPQDTGPTPDIGSIVGVDKSAVDDLLKVQEQKTATDTAILATADKKLDADAARVEKAFAAEGVAAGENLKPWDADKEHRKFEREPIEGFGSLGGLFAMVASAFTKAPMENAINGMAGAINSLKAGDDAAYERAHESWKENTKLALDRFKTQHELYQDALGLMDHNAAAANAKLHNAAVKFGDQQTLTLLEHGMSKELFELQEARAKSAEQMQSSLDSITKSTFERAAVKAIANDPPNTGDPVQDRIMMSARIQRVFDGDGKYGTAEQEAVGRYVQTHMKDPPEKFAEGLAEIHQKFSPKATGIEGYNNAKQAWHNDHPDEVMPADVDAKLQRDFGLTATHGGSAGGGSQSTQARKTRAIEEIQKKHADEGKPISLAEAEKEYNNTVQIPSAHDRFGTEAQYQKAELMEHTMDQVDELLLKHKAITGLGGTLTRPAEAISNILGSNETDRKQFERWVTELQTWGQSVLNDRSGRPLSAEVQKAATEFAGLRPGDTSANTIRSIVEMRPLIKKIKENLAQRYEGKGPLSSGSAPTGDTKPPVDADWLNAYPEKH